MCCQFVPGEWLANTPVVFFFFSSASCCPPFSSISYLRPLSSSVYCLCFLLFIPHNFNLSYINIQSYFFSSFYFYSFFSLFLPYIVFYLLILLPFFFASLHFTIFSCFMLFIYSLTRFSLFITFSPQSSAYSWNFPIFIQFPCL